jgi:hypothetical protein
MEAGAIFTRASSRPAGPPLQVGSEAEIRGQELFTKKPLVFI